MYKYNGGHIEIITGPMFSGKTEELIRRLNRALYADQKVLLFKPTIDDRYSRNHVVSHSKKKFKSINVSDSGEINNYIEDMNEFVDVIAIDEVQFLGQKPGEEDFLIQMINVFADMDIRVILTGLDQDFKGEPFDIVSKLMSAAEKVDKLSAVCVECGAPATRTQRIIDGKPAKYSDPVILVGADESYEARCRKCHEVINE